MIDNIVMYVYLENGTSSEVADAYKFMSEKEAIEYINDHLDRNELYFITPIYYK